MTTNATSRNSIIKFIEAAPRLKEEKLIDRLEKLKANLDKSNIERYNGYDLYQLSLTLRNISKGDNETAGSFEKIITIQRELFSNITGNQAKEVANQLTENRNEFTAFLSNLPLKTRLKVFISTQTKLEKTLLNTLRNQITREVMNQIKSLKNSPSSEVTKTFEKLGRYLEDLESLKNRFKVESELESEMDQIKLETLVHVCNLILGDRKSKDTCKRILYFLGFLRVDSEGKDILFKDVVGGIDWFWKDGGIKEVKILLRIWQEKTSVDQVSQDTVRQLYDFQLQSPTSFALKSYLRHTFPLQSSKFIRPRPIDSSCEFDLTRFSELREKFVDSYTEEETAWLKQTVLNLSRVSLDRIDQNTLVDLLIFLEMNLHPMRKIDRGMSEDVNYLLAQIYNEMDIKLALLVYRRHPIRENCFLKLPFIKRIFLEKELTEDHEKNHFEERYPVWLNTINRINHDILAEDSFTSPDYLSNYFEVLLLNEKYLQKTETLKPHENMNDRVLESYGVDPFFALQSMKEFRGKILFELLTKVRKLISNPPLNHLETVAVLGNFVDRIQQVKESNPHQKELLKVLIYLQDTMIDTVEITSSDRFINPINTPAFPTSVDFGPLTGLVGRSVNELSDVEKEWIINTLQKISSAPRDSLNQIHLFHFFLLVEKWLYFLKSIKDGSCCSIIHTLSMIYKDFSVEFLFKIYSHHPCKNQFLYSLPIINRLKMFSLLRTEQEKSNYLATLPLWLANLNKKILVFYLPEKVTFPTLVFSLIPTSQALQALQISLETFDPLDQITASFVQLHSKEMSQAAAVCLKDDQYASLREEVNNYSTQLLKFTIPTSATNQEK